MQTCLPQVLCKFDNNILLPLSEKTSSYKSNSDTYIDPTLEDHVHRLHVLPILPPSFVATREHTYIVITIANS
jgi:hypothetical protein